MIPVEEFVAQLRERKIKLWLEAGQLRFRAPKGIVTSETAEELRKRKTEILAFLHSTGDDAISSIPDQEHYALSHAQRRLWVLSQMEEGSAAYNIPLHQLLEGALDTGALEAAFLRLIRRHESLRTTFTTIEGEPRQRIHAAIDFRLRTVDLSREESPESVSRKWGREESLRPFDLETGPLFRVTLLKLSEQRHVLLFTLHHIISDGVSIAIFARELSQLYSSVRRGEPNPLPPLRIQYRDYAHWQNTVLESEAVSAHRRYWLEKLSGKIPALNLPTDFPRPATQTFNGHEIHFRLEPNRCDTLRAFNHEHNVSLFMTLLAALKVLLHRYGGQEDIIIGSPFAGRNHPDLEDQIGFYINTIALRDSVRDDVPWLLFLQQIRQTVTEAFDHQMYPFDRLVDELRLERDLSRSPLFDVILILQNQDDSGFLLENLRTRPFFEHPDTSKIDLTFCFQENQDGLHLSIEYNTDLFRQDRISRMGGHFLVLLNSILAHPSEPIGRLAMLTEPERIQILETFNQTVMAYPREKTLPDLFEEQTAKTPDMVAVACEGDTLTYGELNVRSNRLAHYLQALGVGPDRPVGLCLERSTEMVVGLLGILKADGAYVPLDPAFPQERLAYMLEDSQASVLVTHRDLHRLFPSNRATIVCLDRERQNLNRQNTVAPIRNLRPDHLAYIIYTSGSTGKPKGVQIPHQSLSNFLFSMRREPGLTRQDILLAVTTLSFDIAGLELYLPLIQGARVVLVSRETTADGLRLRQALEDSGATVMQATPAGWRMLLAAGWEGKSGLKILCGGEALSRQLADALLERGESVWNLYGPTETTIWSTLYPIKKTSRSKPEDASEPIGRPLANTQVYILDRNWQPVPVGVSGELYIGGDGLARGYFNLPALTAEKFIPHPFSRVPQTRLYKTGDSACFRPDGVIEFLGRLDHQVKIRGFRIETGEIESVLMEHPAVREAVVVARDDESGDQRLAAYIVPDPTAGVAVPSYAEIRDYIRQKLPDYMMPTVFVTLEALPLTPNGKVDRRALPKPDTVGNESKTTYTAPRNDVENTLAALWRETLRVDNIGIHNNFFELGGHSIKATKLLYRIKQEFYVDLRLPDIFREPTIAGLAELIERKKGSQADVVRSPIEEFPNRIALEPMQEIIAPATPEELELLNG